MECLPFNFKHRGSGQVLAVRYYLPHPTGSTYPGGQIIKAKRTVPLMSVGTPPPFYHHPPVTGFFIEHPLLAYEQWLDSVFCLCLGSW